MGGRRNLPLVTFHGNISGLAVESWCPFLVDGCLYKVCFFFLVCWQYKDVFCMHCTWCGPNLKIHHFESWFQLTNRGPNGRLLYVLFCFGWVVHRFHRRLLLELVLGEGSRPRRRFPNRFIMYVPVVLIVPSMYLSIMVLLRVVTGTIYSYMFVCMYIYNITDAAALWIWKKLLLSHIVFDFSPSLKHK